jgi:Avidin family.
MPFTGRWKNQLSSEMVLQVTGSKVTGKYKSAVGEVDPNKEYDLEGFVIDDLIGFTVLWADRKSITC